MYPNLLQIICKLGYIDVTNELLDIFWYGKACFHQKALIY